MPPPITYIGCRKAPRELTALLSYEVVATAANDSDAYLIERPKAEVISIDKPH